MKNTTRKDVPYQALAELRYQIRRFLHFSERAAEAAGLAPQQHQALLAIKGIPANQEATIGTLAERLLIHHHSAVELTNRLEAKRLIRRIRSDQDRRKILIRLTPRGERVLQKLSVLHRAELRSAGPALLYTLLAVVPQSPLTEKRFRATDTKKSRKCREP
jgi:DNA-binding MarR family transcriptional regulator